MPTDCIFCQIVAETSQAHRLAQADGALAFLDIFPVSPGHALVIPEVHAETIYEMPADSMRAVAALVRRVALAIRAELSPDGLGVYQANGRAAGQTVFHYHVHLIPRNEGAGMAFHGRSRGDDEELAALASSLSERIASLPD